MSRILGRAILPCIICVFLFGWHARAYANPDDSAVTTPRVAASATLAEAAILDAPAAGESKDNKGEESKSEGRELTYKTINFIILVGGLAYLLRKPLSAFFLQRSADIRRSLDEGRKALEASQARLSTVEGKLRHLEEEIAAFKTSAMAEMAAERERMHQSAAMEAEKLLASARSRMETTARAAKLELRFFVAQEALNQAEQIIRGRLDDVTRKRLVSQFVIKLDAKQNRN